MKSMTRTLRILLALILALSCLSGAALAEDGPKHVANLVVGTTAANNTFNMTTQKDAFGRMNYNGLTQGNYVYRDANGDLQPYFFENYEISDYYYAGENETEQVILIKKTDAEKYTAAEDFSGVDVGAQNASLQMNLLTSQLPDANPVTIGDLGTGVLELQNGSIEALAVAKGNADMIIDSNPDLMICPWEFEVAAEYEANVILITKGETALLAVVNEALAKAYADGLYGTWYGDAVALAKSEHAAEFSVED